MKKKKDWKGPNISEKEAAELAQATQRALGNELADDFVDEVLALLPKYHEIFSKDAQQFRAE